MGTYSVFIISIIWIRKFFAELPCLHYLFIYLFWLIYFCICHYRGYLKILFVLCKKEKLYEPTLAFQGSCNRRSASQGELETQKRQHDAKLITTKEEEKLKMDKMALELELKWTETLRWVCVHVLWWEALNRGNVTFPSANIEYGITVSMDNKWKLYFFFFPHFQSTHSITHTCTGWQFPTSFPVWTPTESGLGAASQLSLL